MYIYIYIYDTISTYRCDGARAEGVSAPLAELDLQKIRCQGGDRRFLVYTNLSLSL